MKISPLRLFLVVMAVGAVAWLTAATPAVTGLIRQANGEVLLTSAATAGTFYRIDTSADLQQWTPLVTVQSTGTDQFLDSAPPYLNRRFYRAIALTGTGLITGDHLQTTAGDAILHPVNHAAVLVSWNGKFLYSDPGSTASLYPALPRAHVIVVTHEHSDHFGNTVLASLLAADGVIFAPQSVYTMMSSAMKARTTILANGATGSAHGMGIRAVAMYNIPPGPINHAQGAGNGYVVTLGGQNVYFSGDTEDTPEMLALTGIDAAYVCMSLTSNMLPETAASAVRQFRPRIVTPYHYRQGSTTYDIALFKSIVGTDLGIEVRLRNFY